MKQVILIALISIGIIISTEAHSGSYEDNMKKIVVTGEAVVNVKPDKVSIILGIETWDKEIKNAKVKNNAIMRRTLIAIRGLGVEKKNIQTDHLSIKPHYKNDYTKEHFIGYFVRNSISIVLTDPDKIEKLITDVLSAGVTHIHGINFQNSKYKTYRQEARKLALQAAKEKAVNMAFVLGEKIGDPIQINEIKQYNPWSYYSGWWGYGSGQSMSQNVSQNMGGQSDNISETISLGKISIRANVTVTFELK